MMGATYFGEIVELGSRAVWYSDEEDDDDEDNKVNITGDKSEFLRTPKKAHLVSHEAIRANIRLQFEPLQPVTDYKVKDCIISLSSSSHFKNYKTNDPNLLFLGRYENLAKVFICPNMTTINSSPLNDCTLWLMFDSGHPQIVGQEVAYLVEALRKQFFTEMGLSPSSPITVLSQQFSNSEHLEYLTNIIIPPTEGLPFLGRELLPPALIKNQFESALFEQLTLTHKIVHIVCLPDPKDFWFDKALCWPTIPIQLIEHKLSDDNLEKTLIFT